MTRLFVMILATIVSSSMGGNLKTLIASVRGRRSAKYPEQLFNSMMTGAPVKYREWSELYVCLTHQLSLHSVLLGGFMKHLVTSMKLNMKLKKKQAHFDPKRMTVIDCMDSLHAAIDAKVALVRESATSPERRVCMSNLADDFTRQRNTLIDEMMRVRLDKPDDVFLPSHSATKKSRSRLFHTCQEMITDSARSWALEEPGNRKQSMTDAHGQLICCLIAVSSALRSRYSYPDSLVSALLVNSVLIGELIRATVAGGDAEVAWRKTQEAMLKVQGHLSEKGKTFSKISDIALFAFSRDLMKAARLFAKFQRLL